MADHLELTDSVLNAASPADPDEPHLILWNTAAFVGLRPESAPDRVRVDHVDDEGRTIGSFVGLRTGEATVTSGAGAPFGGIDIAKANETVARIEDTVDDVTAQLAAQGFAQAEIRARPAHYGANDRVIEHVLLRRGFEVRESELNFFIDLEHISTVDDYAARLKPAARKMLRRSRNQDLVVVQVAPDDDDSWSEGYEVLRRNRVDRGRPMRLPFDYIQRIRDAFAGRVRMISLLGAEGVVAAALVYRVLPGRDLVQYWGDAGHQLAVSPMNQLVESVVAHALASGASTIDIGISTEDGVPNHGLIQFKRSVGCEVEPRLVLAGPTARGTR